ncbi:MAG: hypothetical protein LBU24_04720 [Methanocalculaceae archaeon]|nr:hypothetical protein [Methanocalculaceae archaeon]
MVVPTDEKTTWVDSADAFAAGFSPNKEASGFLLFPNRVVGVEEFAAFGGDKDSFGSSTTSFFT